MIVRKLTSIIHIIYPQILGKKVIIVGDCMVCFSIIESEMYKVTEPGQPTSSDIAIRRTSAYKISYNLYSRQARPNLSGAYQMYRLFKRRCRHFLTFQVPSCKNPTKKEASTADDVL